MAKSHSKKLLIVNIVGTLGYIVCLLQWLWAIVLYIPLLKQSGVIKLLTPEPTQAPTPVTPAPTGEPSTMLLIIGVVVTITILALTIYIFAKLPTTIGRTGHKLTHGTTTKYIVPMVTRHKKLSQKKKFRLTLLMSFVLKAVIVVAPFLLAIFSYLAPSPLDYAIVTVAAGFLAVMAVGLFGAQLLLIKLLRPNIDKIW